MKNIYLSNAYLKAMESELNERLENNFLHFEYCVNTTYGNDECGSFEFKVNGYIYRVYVPCKLGNEYYTLLIGSDYEQFKTLTDLFNHLTENN